MRSLVVPCRLTVGAFATLWLVSNSGHALDADDFGGLIGYTVAAYTNVRGDFEGADFDKPVSLDNGWIFEFTEYNYSYSYRPTVVVFAKTISVEDLKRLLPGRPITKPLTLYKLLIDDEFYEANRVR